MKELFKVPPIPGGGASDQQIISWQTNKGNYLAVGTAIAKTVRIYDRHGVLHADVPTPGGTLGLCWDKDGDNLAIVCDRSTSVILWDSMKGKTTGVETGLKDALCFAMWSRSTAHLAICTVKGNLVIYNHLTTRKIQVLGKHTRKITCGAWSAQNLIALGGEDKTLTISNIEGDTLKMATLRNDPSLIYFSDMKMDERSTTGENTVSCIINKRTLYLYNLNDPDNPVELAFQSRYGTIVSYHWYGDGYIMIGFSAGILIVISTHRKEIGQEVFQSKDHKDTLETVILTTATSKCATAGDNQVKIHDLNDLKIISDVISVDEERLVTDLSWTDNGQLLAAVGSSGAVHVYLTRLPMLGCGHETRVATLTSLRETTILCPAEPERPVVVIPLDVEPTFLALGPFHLAVGFNNTADFYAVGENEVDTECRVVQVGKHEYLGTVVDLHINAEYSAALLLDGRIQLQAISTGAEVPEDRDCKLLPERSGSGRILNLAITSEFLIYSNDSAQLFYFLIDDWTHVNDFRHSCNIVGVYPDALGIRVVIIDDESSGFVYNPVDDQLVPIPSFLATCKNVLWEAYPANRDVFVAYDDRVIVTYSYSRNSIYEPAVELIGRTRHPYGHHPVMLYNGLLTCQIQSGRPVNIHLETHSFKAKIANRELSSEELHKGLKQCLSLRRWSDAWELSVAINDQPSWALFAKTAAVSMEMDLAIRGYRELRDIGTVLSLQDIKDIEDKQLLSGHIAAILGDFNTAQDLLLKSSNPCAALHLRRDLLQWEAALKLAKTLSPDEVPFISKEYAEQLEFTGDYSSALGYYEKGVTNESQHKDHDEVCAMGVARCSIRTGDIRRGIGIAVQLPIRKLKHDAAAILESMKQYNDAGMLYEKGEYFDKAAFAYIQFKNWSKVGELLSRIHSPKIFIAYAKAKEAGAEYDVAVAAYMQGKDYDNAIRLFLDFLNEPQEAVRVVQETGSSEGAKMVAKFFQSIGDYSGAIQFLVLSKCNNEAFQLAQVHGQMETYAGIIGNEADPEDYRSVALHFEQSTSPNNHFLAGKFFLKARLYGSALRHLTASGGERDKGVIHHEAIELAIEVVGEAHDDQLTAHLIDYLMGDADGIPKDAKYLFRLYMALKQFKEAGRTAIIIAREEQINGNYRNAHDVLFSMYRELQRHGIKIPAELSTNLMILHSYLLVKQHIKLNDHVRAARLLIRVGKNISKFPAHIVPILTSAVIECQKAELKDSAFGYASMLMREEYRPNIDPKYRKKLELLIRRRERGELEESTAPCPGCGHAELHTSELTCVDCRRQIPYCVVTGEHLVADDWCVCPECEFPARMGELVKYLSNGVGFDTCPMCAEKVDMNKLKRWTRDEVAAYFNTQSGTRGEN